MLAGGTLQVESPASRVVGGVMSLASLAQAVHDNFAGLNTALRGNESALTTSLKAFVDLDALTPVEKAQFVCTFMAYLSHSQNAYYQ